MLRKLWQKWRQRRWWVRWIVYGVLPIVLFYAVEDLRGWWALHRYRTDAEARGDRFEIEHYLSEPISDNENFAATPLIREAYRSEGTFEPPTEIDFNQWKFPEYEPEPLIFGRLCRNYPLQTSFPEGRFTRAEAARQIEIDLEAWEPIFSELAEAARRPACRFPYDHSQSQWLIRAHHFSIWHRVSEALKLRALARIETGDAGGALADIETIYLFCRHGDAEGFLIPITFKAAIISVCFQVIWEGLNARAWDEEQLRRLGELISSFDLPADLSRALLRERAAQLAELDRFSSDLFYRHETFSEFRNGILEMPRYFLPGGHETIEDIDGWLSRAILTIAPRGWYWQNQLTICRAWEPAVTYRPWVAEFRSPPASASSPPPSPVKATPYNFWYHLFGFDTSTIASSCNRTQTTCELIETAIALERFRLAEGDYPQSLDALVPAFLDSVPVDRYAPESAILKYRRTPNGDIAIWSVGLNGTDEKGWPHSDEDKGDIACGYTLPPEFTIEDFRK